MAVGAGDVAPDFELPDQHGAPVRLSSVLAGGTPVVLVFYPLAFSGVCAAELSELRDALPRFTAAGARLLTVSVDSVFAHRAWADREGYEFPMLSDFWPHGEVAASYGVFDDEKGVALRGTFVIACDGVVRWAVVNPIPSARDAGEYLTVLAELS
ncbi:peroxiredoxin [Bailinhaonella thermotolerans]|uniref:Alkyl hydroperoxide reductase E n=1 Tax=Bailinhaonella thermotolerans TaxID=1070861 RepID=A0A3A4B0I8_9ACTN|nr:peroxiredoxin [Bailinhaonella thermotolerans]RJL34359.1 peroxiredoxin [Bailinhaonella thermotolerans]